MPRSGASAWRQSWIRSPDPVLVTDHYSRLLLVNPAARHLLGINPETARGKPIDRVVKQPELARLLSTLSDERQTAEVTLPDGQVYLATASSVMAEGHPVGRVCLLRDITHFKELDALKSDFVATVSHDLRSPLTLMRGYATMLEMVGELNEQQNTYVRKIVTSVEDMTRLVTSLLDLGRIEAGINLQLEMVPLHDVVERVVGSLQLQASQKQIQMTTEISPDTIPLVEADQALLQQAMTQPGGECHQVHRAQWQGDCARPPRPGSHDLRGQRYRDWDCTGGSSPRVRKILPRRAAGNEKTPGHRAWDWQLSNRLPSGTTGRCG